MDETDKQGQDKYQVSNSAGREKWGMSGLILNSRLDVKTGPDGYEGTHTNYREPTEPGVQ